jgi:leucyl-tRNA synthetase
MSLAPEHPLALELATVEQREAVTAFIEKVRKQDKINRLPILINLESANV